MKTATVKLLGLITLLFDAGMILAFTSPRMRMLGPLTTAAIVRVVVFLLLTTVVALGLFHLRKWAAMSFALATAALSLWLIVWTIRDVPFPWNLINFGFASLLLVVAAVAVRSWSLLSWRGKWLL